MEASNYRQGGNVRRDERWRRDDVRNKLKSAWNGTKEGWDVGWSGQEATQGGKEEGVESSRGAKRGWRAVHSSGLRSKAVDGCVGPLGPFSSDSLFPPAWLRQLPSWPGAGSPRRDLQSCSWGHSSSLPPCVHFSKVLPASPRFTHLGNPCTAPLQGAVQGSLNLYLSFIRCSWYFTCLHSLHSLLSQRAKSTWRNLTCYKFNCKYLVN